MTSTTSTKERPTPVTMTAQTTQETEGPDTGPTPKAPNLPELYRLLSTLIQDPDEFFDGLIEINATPGGVTVTPWHRDQPAIDLRELPNPMAPTERSGSHGPEEANPEEAGPEETQAGPLKMSIIQTRTDKAEQSSVREILEQEFETAMLHRAKHLLRAEAQDGGAAPPDDRRWDQPNCARNLLAAIKCVFYASHESVNMDEHIDALEDDMQAQMEDMLSPSVLEMLSANCPVSGFTRNEPARSGLQEAAEEGLFQRTKTTISQYNKATLLLACSMETIGANAGAVPWMLDQPEADETPHHQGQLMGSERAAAMRQGMTAPGWTAMTHMDPSTTQAIINQCSDLTETVGIINWLAGLGQKPHTSTLVDLLNRPDVRVKLSQPPKTLQDENVRRAAALAIRNTERNIPGARETQQERQSVADALTYAQVLAMEDRKVTAATFGGLIKGVNRWHAQLNREKTRKQWETNVAANGGVVRKWQPVLGHFNHQEVTATELTDETMLLEEALALDHCVYLYGPRTERETVRIFSLSDQSGGRATTSITMSNGTWHLEQTRARANHPAPEAMRECARELVAACNAEGGQNSPSRGPQETQLPESLEAPTAPAASGVIQVA